MVAIMISCLIFVISNTISFDPIVYPYRNRMTYYVDTRWPNSRTLVSPNRPIYKRNLHFFDGNNYLVPTMNNDRLVRIRSRKSLKVNNSTTDNDSNGTTTTINYVPIMTSDNYSKETDSYNTTEHIMVHDNNDTVPYIIYGIYPNHSVVQKFPNGSRVLDTKLLTLNSTDPTTNSSRNIGINYLNDIETNPSTKTITVAPTTAMTFIQKIHAAKSRKLPTSTIKPDVDPQLIIDSLIKQNQMIKGSQKKPVPEISNSLEENLKTLRDLEKEQSDILKQLAFLNRLRIKQNLKSNNTKDNQLGFINELIVNVDKNKSETNNFESLLNNLTQTKPVTPIYGDTKEAVLAAVLKENGIGPAAKKGQSGFIQNSVKQGFNWLANNLDSRKPIIESEKSISKKKRKKKNRPVDELDTTSSEDPESVKVIVPVTVTNSIDEEDTEKPTGKRKRKRKKMTESPFDPVEFNHVDGVPDDQGGFRFLDTIFQRASKSFRGVFQLGTRALGGILRASSSGSGGMFRIQASEEE